LRQRWMRRRWRRIIASKLARYSLSRRLASLVQQSSFPCSILCSILCVLRAFDGPAPGICLGSIGISVLPMYEWPSCASAEPSDVLGVEYGGDEPQEFVDLEADILKDVKRVFVPCGTRRGVDLQTKGTDDCVLLYR
jgi:hypothetical protein